MVRMMSAITLIIQAEIIISILFVVIKFEWYDKVNVFLPTFGEVIVGVPIVDNVILSLFK